MATGTGIDHEQEFARAWADPKNTRTERPPADVNAILQTHYRSSEPLHFTKTMLWDMEVRKAYHPDVYIPSVCQEGTAETWGVSTLADGSEIFFRKSNQRQRFDPTRYELVLEQVRINPQAQKVTFIGAPTLVDKDGNTLTATTLQPLFDVEHAATGTEDRPVNELRMVHITDAPNADLAARAAKSARSPYLMEFIEIYIRDVLRIELTRL